MSVVLVSIPHSFYAIRPAYLGQEEPGKRDVYEDALV